MFYRKCLIIFLSLTFGSVCFGQNPNIEIKDTLILEPVEVRGFTQGKEITNQAASIAYLSPKEANFFSNTNPALAWSSLPGVRLEQRAVGSYRINIRGSSLRSPFGIRDVKVYWNGIPFTEANGSTALNLLSMDQMQSVEVIRGPAGSLYGAGLGGVVHLSNFPDRSSNKMHANLQIGSFGLFQLGLNGSLDHKNGATYYSFNHQETNGYRDHNSLDRKVYQLSHQWDINDNNQLRIHALFADLRYQIPGGLTEEQFKNDPRLSRPGSIEQDASIDQQTFLVGMDHTGFINKNLNYSTQIGFTITDFRNPFILDYKEDENRELALRHQWTYTKKISIFDLGFDVGIENQLAWNSASNYGNVEGYKDTVRFRDELFINRTSIFAQGRASFNNWSALLGLSSNTLLYEVDRVENAFALPFKFERNFQNQFIPRLSLQYNWSRHHMTYASLSEGFSSPTLDEIRTNEGSINRELEAERGISYELGHKLYSNKLKFEVSLFYAKLTETITTYTDQNGVVLFQNAGETDQKGIEIGMTYSPIVRNKNGQTSLSFRTSYQFYDFRFKNYSKRESDYSNNELPGVPNHTLDEMVHFEFLKNWSLNLHYKYVSEIPLTDANDVYADPFHLFNLNAHYKFDMDDNQLDIALGIENLGDIRYSLGNDLNAFGGRYYQPAPGRNYYLTFSIGL